MCVRPLRTYDSNDGYDPDTTVGWFYNSPKSSTRFFFSFVSERQVAFDLGPHSYIFDEKNNIIAGHDKYNLQCSALSTLSSKVLFLVSRIQQENFII